jgi:hypothetical protein
MNRFLKKEWEDTKIPERAYLQARNRAWTRLHEVARPRRRLIWAAAAATAMVVLGSLWFSGQENLRVSPNPPVLQSTRQEKGASGRDVPAIVSPGQDVRASVPRPKPGPKRSIGKSRKPTLQAPTSESPDRLVLNFVLPESGVRMIWILDKDFQLNGEIE